MHCYESKAFKLNKYLFNKINMNGFLTYISFTISDEINIYFNVFNPNI